MLALAMAWRNIGRNRRRSLLTAGAIAFSVLLLVAAMAMQEGQYSTMINNATALLNGHLQVQHKDHKDNPSLRRAVRNTAALQSSLSALPGVKSVAPRISVFALASNEEKSFGAQFIGVDPLAEQKFSTLPNMIIEGRYLQATDEASVVIGSGLARNLSLMIGDELIVLGNAADDSVAALALTIVGIVTTHQRELDRALAILPLKTVQREFLMSDQSTELVVSLFDSRATELVTQQARTQLAALADDDSDVLVVRPWTELLPELKQMIDLDRASAWLIYGLLALMVLFSIVNTFMMIIFERTREFGMVMALGARPRFVVGLLQLEALMLCGIGVAAGTAIATALVALVAHIGIPLPLEMQELAQQFHLPDRLHPAFSGAVLLTAPALMLLGTQLAALIPAIRLGSLDPVHAMSRRA